MNEFEEPDLTVRLRDMAGGNECHLAYRAAEVITVLREIRGHNDLLIQDLASLVRRMSYAIAHSDNKNPLIRKSIELLKKHNLGGSVLREMTLLQEFKRIADSNLPPEAFCTFARTVAANAIADIEKTGSPQ